MGTKKQLSLLVEKLMRMKFKSIEERGLINSDEIGELIKKMI